MNIDEPQLLELLESHLPTQRWFGASKVTGVDRITTLRSDLPALVQAVVRGDDGDRYQVLVGVRRAVESPAFFQGKATSVMGTFTDGAGDEMVAYDATVDPELAIALLHAVMPRAEVAKVRPLTVEQSNTSLVFDERLILKLFRRLPDGPNPDVEVARALATIGFEHVVAPIAEWRVDDDYGVVNELLVGSADGWHLALTSLHDLYDRRVVPEEAPGDFGFEAERLGNVVGQLHVAMAEAFGTSPPDVEQWIVDMEAQLGRVAIDPAQLERARGVFAALRGVDVGPSIRVHGDLHLGQTLLADRGWFILDFEGEPARPIAERRRPSSPLRDVAGIVRSLHYAAHVALRDIGGADDDELLRLADAWERHNAERFLAGYLGCEDVDDLLPAVDARAVVRRAFELDKALYEVGYELAHRPDWVGIPAAAVTRLLADEATAMRRGT